MLKKALKIIAFLLLVVLVFFAVQKVLTPSWNHYQGCDNSVQGFFALDRNSIDVLFLGTSHVIYGISPMTLYEQTGIRSYNLATSAQPIECSYILLKQAFETQSPKIVFLDVSHMFDDKSNFASYYRNVMDNLYGRSAYLEFAEIYSETEGNDGLWSAVFPIIKYHTRWSELSYDDLKSAHGIYYSMGQFVHSYAGSPASTLESLEKYNSRLFKREQNRIAASGRDGDGADVSADPVYRPRISETFGKYLDKIIDLCNQHEATLILMNIPAMKNALSGGWSTIKQEAAVQFADQHDLYFLDMHYADLIDPAHDYMDGGGHLNLRGSETITNYIGDFLCTNFPQLPSIGTRNEQFDRAFLQFEKVRSVAYFNMEYDLTAYLHLLNEQKDHLTIVISSKSNYVPGLQEREIEALSMLGLELFEEGKPYDTYLAVIQNGKVVREKVSDRRLTYTATLGGHEFSIATNSAYDKGANTIAIDGVEYSLNKAGLNIVVFDNETGLPIDSVNFATNQDTNIATRTKSTIGSMFRAYEKAIMQASR